MSLELLLNVLISKGYSITESNNHSFLVVEGLGVKGIVLTTNVVNTPAKLFFEVEDFWDKWIKCPIQLPLPSNQEELNFLLTKLEWLGTEEGREASSNFEIDICRYGIN